MTGTEDEIERKTGGESVTGQADTKKGGSGLGWLLIAAGVGAWLWGHSLPGVDHGAPTCDGKKMGTSDTCEIFSTQHGVSGSFSYSQMQDKANHTAHEHKTWLEWGGGVAVVVGGFMAL
ncbi:hypothetical protein ACFXHA_44575 [Nocardia sp. NPDC059240]|uniref:hypothetical protein n=1 Tax=Nocardia sp. NPDC059240 TaxID=3346786 RepID=UPI0036B03878